MTILFFDEVHVKLISLTQGKEALVDDADFDVLAKFNWHAQRDSRTFYANRNVPRPEGGYSCGQMHRIVLERKLGRAIAKGMQCDHINMNGLDNRRENLREATRSQNRSNCRRHSSNPSSQYLGVHWHKRIEKWQADVMSVGSRVHLGYFDSQLRAAQARETYIASHPQIFARTNFPSDQGEHHE
jgi:hypothetical protein